MNTKIRKVLYRFPKSKRKLSLQERLHLINANLDVTIAKNKLKGIKSRAKSEESGRAFANKIIRKFDPDYFDSKDLSNALTNTIKKSTAKNNYSWAKRNRYQARRDVVHNQALKNYRSKKK